MGKNYIREALTKLDIVDSPDANLYSRIVKIIRRLNEASVDPQTIEDTKVLNQIKNKIGGKKLNPKNLTAEEQAVLDKYGLDAWGYKGNTRMVSPGKNNILDPDRPGRMVGVKNRWRKIDDEEKAQKKGLVNLADRASKIDDRAKNAPSGWYEPGQTYQGAENRDINNKLSQNHRKMKRALDTRRRAQNDIDSDIEKDYQDSITRARKYFDKKNAELDYNINRERNSADRYSKKVDDILNKYRKKLGKEVQECLRRLTEAKMSPEDEHDSAILRNIISKLQGSSRRGKTKFTDEEKAVMNKYGIDSWGSVTRPYEYNPYGGKTSPQNLDQAGYIPKKSLDKVNFADRVRKWQKRDVTNKNIYSTLKDERNHINNQMSSDYDEVKSNLGYRKSYLDGIKDNEDKKKQAERDYRDQLFRIRQNRDDKYAQSRKDIERANDEINSLLRRNKTESYLKESNGQEKKSIIKTGLDSILGRKKAQDIIDSILGQMSDGMWENSPGMEKYWRFADAVGPDIEVDRGFQTDEEKIGGRYGRYRFKDVYSGYREMNDKEVKKFFANKLKTICQEWLDHNNFNPYKYWNEDCQEDCDYISRDEPITVGECYQAYKILAGK